MEPTNDEIHDVLALFMGYRRSKKWPDYWVHPDGKERDWTEAYLHDLNAMHEVESRLHDSYHNTGWHAYILRLMDLIDGGGGAEFGEIDAIYRVAHATASERARAAYAVIKAQQEAGND